MASDNIPEYSVSELSGQLKRTIEDTFGYVRVRGELGRVTRAGSGHVYLDLKDERATLSSVMWKGTAQRQSVKPEQGMEVVATGRMSTFPGQSRYQLIIDTMAPAGAGALMALLEERKKTLAAEGLFAPERKRPLPRLPRRIGVVTSPSGAVIRDILHRLRDRFPSHVIVWPTQVQGENAPRGIIRGIEGLASLPEGQRPDVVIVARGGGSIEDLWCFNDEGVVRAAAACPIPLISAVGHETDTTLIDYAADVRAPTPTAAAEIAVPVRSELLAQTAQLGARLEQRLAAQVEGATSALRAAERGLGTAERLVQQPAQRLDVADGALARLAGWLVEQRDGHLGRLVPRLQPSLLFRPVERRESRLDRLVFNLKEATARRAERAERRLASLLPRFTPAVLRGRAESFSERLDRAAGRLPRLEQETRASKSRDLSSAVLPRGLLLSRLEGRAAAVEQSGRLLTSFSYKGVLARGFALVTDGEGQLVKTAATAKSLPALEIRFQDGVHKVGQTASGKTKSTKKAPQTQQSLL